LWPPPAPEVTPFSLVFTRSREPPAVALRCCGRRRRPFRGRCRCSGLAGAAVAEAAAAAAAAAADTASTGVSLRARAVDEEDMGWAADPPPPPLPGEITAALPRRVPAAPPCGRLWLGPLCGRRRGAFIEGNLKT
jgi:hypothetical protein